jgi:hypothetical protein
MNDFGLGWVGLGWVKLGPFIVHNVSRWAGKEASKMVPVFFLKKEWAVEWAALPKNDNDDRD